MSPWRAGRSGSMLAVSLALVMVAAGAHAQVQTGPTLADSGVTQAKPAPVYKFKLTPFVARPAEPHGFGLYANAGHRSLDLTQPTTWSVSPAASVSSTQVGVGWRGGNMSAVVGYVRPGSGAQPNIDFGADHAAQNFHPRSMVGFGLAMRFR